MSRISALMYAFLLVAIQLTALTSAYVITRQHVTATLGQNVTLPCVLSDVPYAVFWHKHDYMGASFTESSIVARFFPGKTDDEGHARFAMTADHSLLISRVTSQDETTYTCEVAYEDSSEERNTTDVRVKALANPLHPIILGCVPKGEEWCEYEVGSLEAETFRLTCEVHLVRPTVNLTWVLPNGGALSQDEPVVRENKGLGVFNVSRKVEVSKVRIGEELLCEASGEAVQGSSSTTVSLKPAAEKTSLALLIGVLFGVAMLIIIIISVVIVVWIVHSRRKKKRHRSSTTAEEGEELHLTETLEDKINKMKENISAHTPSKLGKQERMIGSEQADPSKVNIGVFGVRGAGKSTFVSMMLYGFEGDKGMLEHPTPVSAQAGKSYPITSTIKITDYQGFRNLGDPSSIAGTIMKKIVEDRITCPVLVYNVKGLISRKSKKEFTALGKLVGELSERLPELYDDKPMLIISLQDKISEQQTNELRTSLGKIGVHPVRLSFLEKVPGKTGERLLQVKRLEYLELLKALVVIADSNLIYAQEHCTRYISINYGE